MNVKCFRYKKVDQRCVCNIHTKHVTLDYKISHKGTFF